MFKPVFSITPKIANALMRIEAAKQAVSDLPMTVYVQSRLRETARLLSTHYSTQIEGNRLTLDQASKVIHKAARFPDRKRDEKEVLGYYRALDELEKIIKKKERITELTVKRTHALVMSGAKGKIKPTPYRDGQNVIGDSRSGEIVYLPPESKDVPVLMSDLIDWVHLRDEIPCPLKAAIVHYQFATIHPYYDGNGRTARLFTTLLLYQGGYDLKGFYSLEEYYARDLAAYYDALSVGPSHNYYMGRAETDITAWVEYFCRGMAASFSAVQARAQEAAQGGKNDQSSLLRQLDARQRKTLSLFAESKWVTASQIGKLFNIKDRTARDLCRKWVESGFLSLSDPAKKSRKYELQNRFKKLLE